MSDTTLGLDLGPNSIGWALVDEDGKRIVATGVRIFPEGVDRDTQGHEVSKNEARRIARGMRRQIARRARRKRRLRETLIEAGLYPRDPQEQAMLDVLDPYPLRAKALREPLSAHQIGRLLIHLNQRRGFLSNRKVDRAARKETSDMLAEISGLAQAIESSGCRTLGEHLAQLHQDPHCRIRGKHTRRDMYEKEFDAVWAGQQVNHPALMTPELQDRLRRILFFQRKMYWPRSVVGRCELDPKQPRCPRADRLAQRFRLLQEVNNLRLIDARGEVRPLHPDERTRVIEYLSRAKERTFDQIRGHLDLLENETFNLEERKKLLGMPTDAALAHKSLFGKGWYDRPEDEKNAVVCALIDFGIGRLAEDALVRRAVEEWHLDPEAAESLADTNLPEGYASFGRETIEKLLPYLERGLPLMADDERPSAMVEAGYLRPDQRPVRTREFLPAPPDIANPIVRQSLHEVRKVVNAIIREYGKPASIHVELAREVKGSLRQRMEIAKRMQDREDERNDAAERIREFGAKPTREAIDRQLLWQEQGGICVYSNRPISMAQLFGGEVDIDHILPYSRSLDNSLANRVVCFRDSNRDKGDRTPHEWLATSEPTRYDEVCQRAARLPYNKRQKFLQRTLELGEFISRQLVDTAYISKAVRHYLRCLGTDVLCSKGQLTAELRQQWGLNTALRDDGLNLKSREDHRHHAVDAIVMALTDRKRLQQLARTRRWDGEQLEEPWAGFRATVEDTINAIHVSHRVRRKVAGALHEETVYGPTGMPGAFVYRKPLESLTTPMVHEIRDETVKQLVIARLQAHGIEPSSNTKIPAQVWKEPLRMASGVPIRKVRLVRRDLTIQPIRGGKAYVKPGALHHLCLFEYQDNKGKTRREAVFVSMLEAIQRIKQRQSVIQRQHPTRDGARFVMSLSRGEMVVARFDGQERLLCFRTAASTQGQIYFVHHTDARPSSEMQKLAAKASTLDARKVTVDPLGRLRWAND